MDFQENAGLTPFGGTDGSVLPALRRRKPRLSFRSLGAYQSCRPPSLGVDGEITRLSPRWGSGRLSCRVPGAYAAWLLTFVPLGLRRRTRGRSRLQTRNAMSRGKGLHHHPYLLTMSPNARHPCVRPIHHASELVTTHKLFTSNVTRR